MRFACYRSCKKSFAGSGRTNKECSFWKFCAYSRIFLRIVKEIHYLYK